MKCRSYRAVRKGVIAEDIKEYRNTVDLHHQFSEDFNAKITRISRIEFKTNDIAPSNRFSFKRMGRYAAMAVIAAAIAINGMMTLMADAPRESNLTFGMKTRPVSNGMLEVNFLEGDLIGNQTLPIVLDYQRPTYIPEDYDLIEECKDESANYMVFENDEGEMVTFSQHDLWGAINVNRKDAYVREVEINGFRGVATTRNESGETVIVWSDGNYKYTVSCSSDKFDIFKFAESVQSDENKIF